MRFFLISIPDPLSLLYSFVIIGNGHFWICMLTSIYIDLARATSEAQVYAFLIYLKPFTLNHSKETQKSILNFR